MFCILSWKFFRIEIILPVHRNGGGYSEASKPKKNLLTFKFVTLYSLIFRRICSLSDRKLLGFLYYTVEIWKIHEWVRFTLWKINSFIVIESEGVIRSHTCYCSSFIIEVNKISLPGRLKKYTFTHYQTLRKIRERVRFSESFLPFV